MYSIDQALRSSEYSIIIYLHDYPKKGNMRLAQGDIESHLSDETTRQLIVYILGNACSHIYQICAYIFEY